MNITVFKFFTKEASRDHVIITGHSGSGKSRHSRQLSGMSGMPIHALDDDPEIRDFLNYQKGYFDKHKDYDRSEEANKRESEVLDRALNRAFSLKSPHILDGTYFLKDVDKIPKGMKTYLVDKDEDYIRFNRTGRSAKKRILAGKDWTDEDDAMAERRANLLLDHYRPGVEKLRARADVEKIADLTQEQQNLAGGAGAAALGTGAILSKYPQKLLGRSGVYAVKNFGGATVTPEQMAELSKEHGIKIEQGAKSSFVRGGKDGKKVTLGGGTGNMATLHHELGHAADKNIIDRSKLDKGSVKHTLATLRNEGVANINAVRSRGLKQIPHALGAYATYLAGAGVKHRKGLAALSAIPLAYGGYKATQAINKEARAPRDYKREYEQYHSKPQRVAERSQRNQARRIVGLKKGDPREVDHKNPISNGGSNVRSNLRAVSLEENRKKFTKTAFDSDALTARILNFFASKGVKTKDDRPLTKAEQNFFNKRFKGKKIERGLTKKASLLQQSVADDRERTYGEMRDAIRGFAAKQNIDPEKAMLVAGGAGYMHGMRDEVNDLDFFHDDLPDFVKAPHGRFDMDGGPGKDLPDAAKQYQIMHGMRVQTPEAMLAFYQRLNRPKDQEKIKMLKEHLKMASYRPRVDSIIYKRENGKVKVLAAKDDTLTAQGIGFQSSPYSFPGGGVEPDQDPISAAQMEAMEEAGVMGKDFKLISNKPKRISLDQDWRDRQYKKRGERLKGVYNYSVIGEYDQDNNSILGRDNDAWNFSWYPAEDVVDSLKKDKGQFRAANKVNARALQSLLKTASNQHYLVTGHSGAGKSTLSRKLSEETGAPIVSLDDVPSIRAILQEQKDMARAHPEGKLNLTPELSKKYEAIELKAIQDAIAAKNPSIIEGSYFLKHNPEMFSGNKMMLVDRDRDTILNQRVERQRLKELGRGGEWSDERAAGVRTRGNQLLDYYQPGVDTWRNSSLVEKRAATLYHGSPYEGLTSLQPSEPRGNTDYERQKAVFMTDNPDGAALYALARDKDRRNRGWATVGGRLKLGPDAKLNEKGYIYNVDTDDYLSPPKGEEPRGFAIPREINVSGVKEVTPSEYEHLIDRFDTKDAFRDHVNSLIEKKASNRHHLITGVPGAGKSTIAKRIAKEKGLPLFEIDSDPRFKRALQLVDEGKMDESNALQRQMFRDAVARKDPHVIEGAQIMLDPALARQHNLHILDDSADVLAPRWAKREAGKHKERAASSGKLPTKDEAYYDKLYRNTVYPRYQKQLEGLRKTAGTSLTKKASKLTAAARNQISEDNFALPGRRYPIHDITHARSALSMVAAHGTPAEKSTVRKAVHAKFPSIAKK